ncbi:M23 family metallopeptidase [Stakelama tenebrarum]|uniref:M23 family metallopeptidase n=1 Tax=Stakelama tenebrarum TaxID=2711215 RepID=A0A6G6Y9P9_9SPHN|nr:M23 family metallopeptidase [Sphingosinithalassobacter tenebrarum]QIG81630.1 M23 family metallopeptidase [Sphingosinithalassobacter tenebrarum]
MFLRNDHGYDLGGGANALSNPRTAEPVAPAKSKAGLSHKLRARFPDFELVPDLGSRIGSLQWYRGVATCVGLCAVTLLMAPGLEDPIYGYVPPALQGEEWEAARVQAISPLADGAKTGYDMAATGLVAPLADTPERPIIDLTTKISSGGTLLGALQRSGVGATDAANAVSLIGDAISLRDLQAGTPFDVRLGRRSDKSQPRPLERLGFRARFDLSVEVSRGADGTLALRQIPIAVDSTPLRIRGKVGSSLYRSARAAGAPAKAVEAFIRAIATRMSMSQIGADADFEMIVARDRAETGEVRFGNVLFGGIQQGSTKVQLASWDYQGRTEWFDMDGKGEKRGSMVRPVHGRLTSSFGMRWHPVLGRRRMHKGWDIAAPSGTPIRAIADGRVTFSGRNGGYGNFVRLRHSSGLQSAYGHMLRTAVRSGARVRRGDVIGYVGSTGVSTGPHVHFEVLRGGVAVNPGSVSFMSQSILGGGDLSSFRANVSKLLKTPVQPATEGEAAAAAE